MPSQQEEIERIVEELLYQFRRDNVEEDGTMYGRMKQPTEMLINRLQDSMTQALTTYGNARVEEIIKIAEKMKKEGLEDVLEWLPEHGYNEALDELIEAIKK